MKKQNLIGNKINGITQGEEDFFQKRTLDVKMGF